MTHDPQKPLLRLNAPREAIRRPSGSGGSRPRKFDRDAQSATYSPIFQRLSNVLARENGALTLRNDPASLAPERLLVFEVTGSVKDFANAVARVPGLEFAGEEILEADADEKPEYYLLVPQLEALRQIVSLWEHWKREGRVPRNYGPWKDLFLQLRALRPWGPADRVSAASRVYFIDAVDDLADQDLFRVEIELVFRASAEFSKRAEEDIQRRIEAMDGRIIHVSRRVEFAYHAILADISIFELRRICALDPNSLAGADPIAAIVPQSTNPLIDADDTIAEEIERAPATVAEPVLAIFDAVPLQAHSLLDGRLIIDDPTDLEAKSVGQRIHGTAMASLVVHGDLNSDPSPISRRVYFRPVMYAPAEGQEKFDSDRLVIDVIVEAVMRMRANGGQNVIVVNLSLGDTTKPFSNKISTWARALDYLAYTYGILFLVSAGNIKDGVVLNEFADGEAFENATPQLRSTATFRAMDSMKADRRVLAPGDSVNAITVGAWHEDSSRDIFPGASPFAPYIDNHMPNLSSRLGPGLRRGTKPEVLFAGGKERARLDPVAAPVKILSHLLPSRYWGLKVAAPSPGGLNGQHFMMGTSVAAALASHTAHRIFDALELAYPQIITPMPLVQRAALLKVLLVHSASWRGSEDFIRSIIDPGLVLHNEHWRREVCRHLGYGFVDPENAIACASDRATLWATGTLNPEGSYTFDVPIPSPLAINADYREIRSTLAWFSPIRPGHLAYRAVKLKIASLQEEALNAAGVRTFSGQPSNTQAENGTVVHRRWCDSRVGNSGIGRSFPLQIQRQNDQGIDIDEPISFGLAVTVEMPGQVQIYEQIRAQTQIQPAVPIAIA